MNRLSGAFLCLLLGLPLAGAGALCAWIAGKEARDAKRARDWVSVKAEVLPGGLGAAAGSRRTGSFAYSFEGRRYETRRLSTGSLWDDDIDQWRSEFAEELQKAKAAGRGVSLWVNPDDPAESAFYRDAQWDRVILFGLLALGVGGAGLGALRSAAAIAAGRAADGKVANGGTGAGFLWIFALLWNGFAYLVAFLALPDILESREWGGLLLLLFPLVGAFLIWAAAGATGNAIKASVARGARPPPPKRAAKGEAVDLPFAKARAAAPGPLELPASVASVTRESGAMVVRFSINRNWGFAAVAFFIGLLLTAIGAVMLQAEGVTVPALLLLAAGIGLDVAGVAILVRRLSVRASAGAIAVERGGLFGRRRWELTRETLAAIRPVLSYTVNNEPVFTVRASTRSGEDVVLGDTLKGEQLALAYARHLVHAAGFPPSLVGAPGRPDPSE